MTAAGTASPVRGATVTASPGSSGAAFWPVVWALSRRGLQRMTRRVSLIIPVVAMPVFFVVAFSGTFNSLSNFDAYGTDEVINWMVPWAVLQGAAFAGMGAAGSLATDLEGGFFDRLLLAPVPRTALVAGPLLYAGLRSLIPTTLVIIVSVALGADLEGGVLAVVVLYVAAIGVSMVMGLLGTTVVLIIGNLRALALAQVLLFTFMFLSIGQVPLSLMDGWLHAVARVNPMTNILRMARQGLLGDVSWTNTWPGLVAIGGLMTGLGLAAVAALRRRIP
ncbi:MAG: ABC transporter permease [Acidimicrobiales bacterium]|nr:ABC transporter permease [Acidimicrobiales bacterium]